MVQARISTSKAALVRNDVPRVWRSATTTDDIEMQPIRTSP